MILTPLKQWMLVALLSIGSVTAYAQDVKMTYPQAEWSKAQSREISKFTKFCGMLTKKLRNCDRLFRNFL